MPVDGTRYITDILREFEMKNKNRSDNFSNHFLFKKKFHSSAKTQTTDLVDLQLLYTEAVNYVLLGKHPMDEELATNLAALMLQVRHGDHDLSIASEAIDEYG